jgi:hypothetical protein
MQTAREHIGHLNASGQSLFEFESAIRAHTADKDFSDARAVLRDYLWAQVGGGRTGTIAEAVAALAESSRPLPAAAAVLLRSLAIDGLLPSSGPSGRLDREVVKLVEISLPRLCDFIGVDKKAQTFEKFSKLRGAHHRICEILGPLTADYRTLEGLISARQPINGALNHSCVRAYGEIFGLGTARAIIEGVLHSMQEVARSQATFVLDVDNCRHTIEDALEDTQDNGSFLFRDLVIPFLKVAEHVLQRFINSARGRFSAKIVCLVRDGDALPKRYPLYDASREIQIKAPFRNTGPGIAIGVRATIEVTSGNVVLQTPDIVIGDVSVGDFSLAFDVMVIEPTIRAFPIRLEQVGLR